jgi:Flp pilus assembly protein TadG
MSRLWLSTRRRAAHEAGTAVVELALVLPILLALVFGLLDLGRAYNYWLDSTHLANEGARLAAVGKSPAGVLNDASTPELKNGTGSVIQKATLVCTTKPGPGSTNPTPDVGDEVTVTVTSKYRFIPLPGPIKKLADATITGSATMRLETTPPAGC